MEIPGNPIPQARHRHFKFGVYDPCKKDKEHFLSKAFKNYNYNNEFNHLPRLDPLYVKIIFHLKRPKYHYGTGRNTGKLKEKYKDISFNKKPDIDNLVKFVFDALQGHNGFYLDDSQIIQIIAEKQYSETPHTSIWIYEEKIDKN